MDPKFYFVFKVQTLSSWIQLYTGSRFYRISIPTAKKIFEFLSCTAQAIQFSDHLRSRKSEASAEVIGRAEIDSEQAMQSLMQGPPAERILVYILSLKGFDDVVEAVCEAFMPPDDTHTSAAVSFSSSTNNELILWFDSYSAQP